jgi:prepilin-type N-terminal cleavage/methylation domain-containing protein
MNKKAFTLVELLVVISIIAMLLAILMPSLQKARMQGQRVVCGSNTKTLIYAMLLYTNENKQAFPNFSKDSEYVADFYAMWGRKGNGPGVYSYGADKRPFNNYLGKFKADDEVKACMDPSDKGDPTWNNKSQYMWTGSSYRFNAAWWFSNNKDASIKDRGRQITLPNYKTTNLYKPTQTVALACATSDEFVGGTETSSWGTPKGMRWHDVKKPTANYAYTDGHLKYLIVVPGHTNSNYSWIPWKVTSASLR